MFTKLFHVTAAGFLLALAIWSYQAGLISAPRQIVIGILQDAVSFTNGLK